MTTLEPTQYSKVAKSEAWRTATKVINMIEKNNTRQFVKRLYNQKVIGVKWVTKLNSILMDL